MRSFSVTFAVTMMMGMWQVSTSARSFLVSSMPSICGIIRSVTMASGSFSLAMASPCSPLGAKSTLCLSPSRLPMNAATSALSSIISIEVSLQASACSVASAGCAPSGSVMYGSALPMVALSYAAVAVSCFMGRTMWKVVPLPSVLSALIVPPSDFIIWSTRASPTPLPQLSAAVLSL